MYVCTVSYPYLFIYVFRSDTESADQTEAEPAKSEADSAAAASAEEDGEPVKPPPTKKSTLPARFVKHGSTWCSINIVFFS